jgi:hypothetical protein
VRQADAGTELGRWVNKVAGAFLAADEGGLLSLFGTVTVPTAELEALMTVDWSKVDAATSRIRNALDPGGFGVRGDDLEAIEDAIAGLDPAEADAVVSRLTDDELRRWMDNLHESWFKGGWDHERRQEMWSRLGPLLSLESLDRIGRLTDDLRPSFAGIDNPDGIDWRRIDGPLFATGETDTTSIDFDDVRQLGLGDCYLLASLAAIAAVDPDRLRQTVRRNSNGTYTVTFRDGDREIPITVTPDFPVRDGAPSFATDPTTRDVDPPRSELWPLVVEKAYAQWKGGYDDIEGGYPHEAMEELLGSDAEHESPDDLTLDELADRHEGAQAIALSTFSDRDGRPLYESRTLVTSHAYYVTDVDREAGTVTVRNPWGTHLPPLVVTFDELQENFDDVSFIGT